MSTDIYTVYLITNTINEKKYVGITTKRVQARWNGHLHHGRENNTPYLIHKALHKYGAENFQFTIIDTCDTIDKLKELEVYYIEKYKSYYIDEGSHGYNMTKGGEVSPMDNAEIRTKVSETMKSLGDAHWTKQESFKSKMRGDKNPSFKGYYVTPYGTFASARSMPHPLLNRATMISLCVKNNDKPINGAMLGRNLYLKQFDKDEILGKTPKELGFYFVNAKVTK